MSIQHIELNRGTIAQLFKLPEQMIDYLWECIDVAKKRKINVKETLAGHISRSYKLEDPQNFIIENVFNVMCNQVDNPKMFNFIMEELDLNTRLNPDVLTGVHRRIWVPRLYNLWVNFQKKGEFQPIHNHSGLLSFVIWMDIPYHSKDEAKVPFTPSIKNRHPPGGNFCFTYSSGINRSVCEYTIEMSPNMNGYCCFFPSDLCHQVYPFYTSDKDRISISGNIVFEMVDVPPSQQFPFLTSNP